MEALKKNDVRFSFRAYDTFARWASYWYQIRAVLESPSRSVVFVGMGNGLVPAYLRAEGCEVRCVDLRAELGPELVGDVRQLAHIVPPRSVDAVCAFQILEHLPYEDFVPTLKQMAAVASKNVFISLPVAGRPVMLRLRYHLFSWFLSFQFPFRNRRRMVYPKHNWELNTHGYSISSVRRDIESVLEVTRAYTCPENPYHYFFECRVRP